MTTKTIVIIPARIGSTRLPRKVLADINGKTLLERAFFCAKESGFEVCVACDDKEVAKHVSDFGGSCVLTDPNLNSGTDRVCAALDQLEKAGKFYDTIVNLQGDIPSIKPSTIAEVASLVSCVSQSTKNAQKANIGTAVIKLQNIEDAQKLSIVKPVLSFTLDDKKHAKALYFSRSVVPHGAKDLYAHLGIYSFKADSLKEFVRLGQSGPSALEACEKLEQLRALEHNMTIHATIVDDICLSIDTPEDLDIARSIVR